MIGKSHLACPLGYAACLARHSVLFATSVDIINPLVEFEPRPFLQGPGDQLVAAYDRHMKQVCGLSEGTRHVRQVGAIAKAVCHGPEKEQRQNP